MTAAFAEPMPFRTTNEPAARRPEGALWRFWPRAVVVPVPAIASDWRDSLTKFCPGSRRATVIRRRRRSRPRSIGHRALSRTERRQLKADETYLRRAGISLAHPAPRSNCDDAPGPCPFVGCRQHLYLEVNPRNGSIKLNFPDKQPWELEETCAIRVAKRGPQSLEVIGKLLNITMERVSQIHEAATPKLRAGAENLGTGDDSGTVGP